ncbi:hypothetical protein T492DRAFT_850391 [Pavlovales sp. CCMP2436]|nr:hypothetical protein T492DRAFT_850391 [Pavlovales sp. CCMP2436]
MTLPYSLGTTGNRAVGIQYSYSAAIPISAGCICLLGDTKILEDEVVADPKASTYTLYQLLPEGDVGITTYTIPIYKYVFRGSSTRLFSWNSLDTPALIIAKWKATMDTFISSQSYGHCTITFDPIAADLDFGTTTNVFYAVDRYYGNNVSKNGLGFY